MNPFSSPDAISEVADIEHANNTAAMRKKFSTRVTSCPPSVLQNLEQLRKHKGRDKVKTATMDEQHLPKSKRQRLAVVSKNEAKDTHTGTSGGVLTLPIGVLSNCFSFLGSSGRYYFLASVCKYFKAAVHELYQGNCNTSIEAIIASVSTVRHVEEIIRLEDEYYGDDMEYRMHCMIREATYKYDRPDLLEYIGVNKYTLSMICTSEAEETFGAIMEATENNCTEIMRSIIVHELDVISRCLRIYENCPDWGTRWGGDSIKRILSKSSAACDPEMISQLVEKGVKFDNISIEYSLTRKDLDTFKCLLDKVQIDKDKMRLPIILKALQHEMHLDAMKCLKEKHYFETIFSENNEMDVSCVDRPLRLLFEGRLDNIDKYFGMVLGCCLVFERIDMLSYIHENFRRLNTKMRRFLIQFAEEKYTASVANFQRTLSNLP